MAFDFLKTLLNKSVGKFFYQSVLYFHYKKYKQRNNYAILKDYLMQNGVYSLCHF
ncbi:primase-like DNA-binding domain-containing protein [Metamycoplasma equirhinis]|uniref:primase-like DNA-binding domain-containing protein n=1 Tax=Metamycoplasma equirhinis TaxID=92402 RepID=UPI003593B4F2